MNTYSAYIHATTTPPWIIYENDAAADLAFDYRKIMYFKWLIGFTREKTWN